MPPAIIRDPVAFEASESPWMRCFSIREEGDWVAIGEELRHALATTESSIFLIRGGSQIPKWVHDQWREVGVSVTRCWEEDLADRLFSAGTMGSVPAVLHVPSRDENPTETTARVRSTHPREEFLGGSVPTEIAREDRAAIWKKTFRADVRRWIATYNRVGERDTYLWQWCLHGIELTTLPCVSLELRDDLYDTKLLSVILCVLFDDVADQTRDAAWLEDLLKEVQGVPCIANGVPSPASHSSADRPREIREHVEVTRALWQEYEQRVAALPRYPLLKSVWRFDLDQFLTAMKYAQLVNLMPELMNPTEHDVYTPHNMLMVSFGTLDFMASPEIDIDDRGAIREALWHVQAMGRIGNILSTWKRELRELDRSNGLISRAVSDGVLSLGDLRELTPSQLEDKLKRSDYEARLTEKWHRHRRLSHRCVQRVKSLDLTEVLQAHDRFLEMHLSSAGLI
ncbi:MAG: hypothetical protein KDA80_15655 [Planctomycetaceae bacterium]|nr:hypothetical protein [Planctomycetaceae bacterium]